MSNDPFTVADAFNAAIKARSEAALAEVYADDAVIWNNATQADMTKADNVAVLGSVFRIASELEYVDVRRELIDGGFVQMHKLVGTFNDGVKMPDLHACLIVKTRGDQIVRIDEYFDLSVYGPVFQRISEIG
jgi:limonene-1,2-epoxide hydrolase